MLKMDVIKSLRARRYKAEDTGSRVVKGDMMRGTRRGKTGAVSFIDIGFGDD